MITSDGSGLSFFGLGRARSMRFRARVGLGLFIFGLGSGSGLGLIVQKRYAEQCIRLLGISYNLRGRIEVAASNGRMGALKDEK